MMCQRFGRAASLIALAILVALCGGAPHVAPNAPDRQFSGLLHAPPTTIHFRDDTGQWRRPFIRPFIRLSQLEQRYEPGRDRIPLIWFGGGHVVQSSEPAVAPLLLLGADSVGRDVFSRLLYGARISLALALVSTALAIVIGAVLGAWAGYHGGVLDLMLMRGADFVLALPAMHAALVLRALLPAVLSVGEIFILLASIFAIMGAPVVARGVRGIIVTERDRDYVSAARSLGASTGEVVRRHLLPATRPFLAVQSTLLVPAFVVAEATFSYVGLGFPDPSPTWGTMLQEASSARALADLPWLLSPAVAMFVVVLAIHAVGRRFETADTLPRL